MSITVTSKTKGPFFVRAKTNKGYGLYGPYKTKAAALAVIRRYGWKTATIT